jgi:uncharacterized protein (TIGR00297 family)
MELSRSRSISWQSKAVLLLILPVLAAHMVLDSGHEAALGAVTFWTAIGISVTFGVVVFLLRAATAGGAATGALVAATLYLWTPGWHTALWPLGALVALTVLATRFGRRAKESMGIAEGRRGRTAAQVASNIGVAAVCGVPLTLVSIFSATPVSRIWLVGMVAALGEATADTLSSELGQVLGGEPRLLTTLRSVPRGTDGAVTLVGTLCGIAGAAIVVAVAVPALAFGLEEMGVAFGAAVAGLFADSLLGEWVERSGWLGNDAVNALSTLAAALVAVVAMRWLK